MSELFRPYKVAAVYDTETTNFGSGSDCRAFPVLFIVNDIRNVKISEYVPGKSDDVRFYRHDWEFFAYLLDLIHWGNINKLVPVIASYNLSFDLQPVIYELCKMGGIHVSAQTSANVYTFDILDDSDACVLRFWDTWFLEQNGLAAMGRTCGLPKASGDWDYDLVRTPETPLTDEELYYAGRDTQVIPAYLRWLLDANAFIEENELGYRVITKSSIVRRMAEKEIGKHRFKTSGGHRMPLSRAFEMTCAQELPQDYLSYALRKACFRGGFTFTAAETAVSVVRNVASIDVTSMHHAFINGRRVPVHFTKREPWELQIWVDQVNEDTTRTILQYYDMPFSFGFHAKLRYENIRLKKGCAFERYGIGLIPQEKFALFTEKEYGTETGAVAEDLIREQGFYCRAKRAEFCLAKLMSAEIAELFVTEIEAWCIAQVYDFDTCRVIYGEGTGKSIVPPDYVTLQSNKLFELKREVKEICKHYREGEPFTGEISNLVPKGIAAGLRAGTLEVAFLHAYLQNSVKGMFNGIYGTQAMDLFRPDFACDLGEVHVDETTGVSPETFDEKLQAIKHPRVFYNFGSRIVGGSRMHLVIAIQLLFEKLGDRIQITGGDTDSLKIACSEGVTGADLLDALEPLHTAIRAALAKTQKRIRETYPDLASGLDHVGEFEVENDGHFYQEHMELWNKARVSWDGERAYVTCAGLSRPAGTYHIEDFIRDLIRAGHPFGEVVPLALGFNVRVDHEICHALERHKPLAWERFEATITDYTGRRGRVETYESIALYPSDRLLGDPAKPDNAATLAYLEKRGRRIEQRTREDVIIDGRAAIRIETPEGIEIWS